MILDADGIIQHWYTYDDLGQLIREDDRAKGYSYTYVYDNAGNILAKKQYAFSIGALGEMLDADVYFLQSCATRSNDKTSNWKYFLTFFLFSQKFYSYPGIISYTSACFVIIT